MKLRNLKKSGFTLLELLVVIAILATLAGGALVAYDGLDKKAARGQATFNISAIDKAFRTFKVVNGSYPDNLDGLILNNTAIAAANGVGDATATAGGWMQSIHSKMQGSDGVATTGDGKLVWFKLHAEGVSALNAVGITKMRVIDNTLGTGGGSSIPNRIFDAPTRGQGTELTLTTGSIVPIMQTKDWGGNTARLRDIKGLDETKNHAVVVFGLGNNATIISAGGGNNAATLSETPFYTDVDKSQYGRFLVLFHIGTDTDDNGTIDASETFSEAVFLAVLDSKGEWYDEEFAEFTGQKK
jgi:prepilin-type N-terminal cleavage/methylation domain-containing protein